MDLRTLPRDVMWYRAFENSTLSGLTMLQNNIPEEEIKDQRLDPLAGLRQLGLVKWRHLGNVGLYVHTPLSSNKCIIS